MFRKQELDHAITRVLVASMVGFIYTDSAQTGITSSDYGNGTTLESGLGVSFFFFFVGGG